MDRTSALMSMWKDQNETGESLTFEQCKGGRFSTLDDYGLKVVGKTHQDSFSGKNLLSIPKTISSELSIDGLTVTYNETEQTLTFNGQYSNQTIVKSARILMDNLIPNADYAFSVECISGNFTIDSSAKPNIFFAIQAKTDTSSAANTFVVYTETLIKKGSVYKKTNSGEKVYPINFTFYGNYLNKVVFNNWTVRLQFEKGATATQYEPYCGGIPIPSPDHPTPIQCVKEGSKIECRGKNIFNTRSAVFKNTGYIMQNDGKIIFTSLSSGNTSIAEVGSIHPGTYVISTSASGLRLVSENVIDGWYYNSYYQGYFKDFANTAIVTIENQTNMSFVFKVDDAPLNIPVYYQIEKGSNPTHYEPYIGNTITTPCDLYEGDIWYPMTGKVIKATTVYEITGNEEWIFNGAYGNEIRGNVYKLGIPKPLEMFGYSNNYPYFTIAIKDMNHIRFIYGSNYFYIAINDTRFNKDTVSDFIQMLKNESVKVVYKKDTPTIEQYAPQPIFAPKGIVNVLQQPVELTADLSATMLVHK